MNKIADFPLERAGLGDAPDETVIVAWPGWSLTVGDVRQARKAPPLMRGAVASVGFKQDGIIGINWMRPERVDTGDLLYIVDRTQQGD